MGESNFWPSRESTQFWPITKKCCKWLDRRPLRLWQIWCKSVNGALLDKWVKYNEIFIYLFIYFFMNSPTDQTHWRIFTLDGSNDADSRKDVPFGGFVDIAPHFGGENPIFGAWIGVFKPNLAMCLLQSIQASEEHGGSSEQTPLHQELLPPSYDWCKYVHTHLSVSWSLSQQIGVKPEFLTAHKSPGLWVWKRAGYPGCQVPRLHSPVTFPVNWCQPVTALV